MDPVTLGIIAGTKLVAGGIDMYRGAQMKKKGEAEMMKNLNEIRNIEYTNQFASLQTPSLPFEISSQERLGEAGQALDVAKDTGARGAIAAATGIARQQEKARRQDQGQMAELDLGVQKLRAEGATFAEKLNKEKDINVLSDLAQLGQAKFNAGQKLQQAGLEGVTSGLTGAIGAGYSNVAADPYNTAGDFSTALGISTPTRKISASDRAAGKAIADEARNEMFTDPNTQYL